MKYSIRLRDEADLDLSSAASWYEQQRTGLGQEFLDEVATTFHSISDEPLRYPLIRRNSRRALIKRFPFAVYYCVEETSIIVVAIMHGSRHPSRWQRRT